MAGSRILEIINIISRNNANIMQNNNKIISRNNTSFINPYSHNNYSEKREVRAVPSRSKIPSNKVQINPLISRDLYEVLLEYYGSQGKGRGVISQIVEEALRLYFSVKHSPPGGETPSPPDTHTHKKHNNAYSTVIQSQGRKKEDVKSVFYQVLDEIKRSKNIPSNEIICEIRKNDLIKAISAVRGIDERTIRKWIRAFLANKLIKEDQNVYIVVDSACPDLSEYLKQLSNA